METVVENRLSPLFPVSRLREVCSRLPPSLHCRRGGRRTKYYGQALMHVAFPKDHRAPVRYQRAKLRFPIRLTNERTNDWLMLCDAPPETSPGRKIRRCPPSNALGQFLMRNMGETFNSNMQSASYNRGYYREFHGGSAEDFLFEAVSDRRNSRSSYVSVQNFASGAQLFLSYLHQRNSAM